MRTRPSPRRRHVRTTSIFLLAALGLATGAAAQNLVTNPDFDAGLGLASWLPANGTWVLGPDSGSCLLSDSAAGTSAEAGGVQSIRIRSEACIPVDPAATPTLQLGGLYQTSAAVWARLYLQFFSDGACGAHSGWSGFVYDSISPSWRSILGPVSIPPTTGSVRVWADFNPASPTQPQFTGSYDRFYLGVPAQIFADGFETESGSACHWSSIVGEI